MKGGQPDKQDNRVRTLLSFTAVSRCEEVMKILLELEEVST